MAGGGAMPWKSQKCCFLALFVKNTHFNGQMNFPPAKCSADNLSYGKYFIPLFNKPDSMDRL